jgi:hypothetical protein
MQANECKQMKKNILKYAHDVERHYLELTLSPFLWGTYIFFNIIDYYLLHY